MKEQAYIAWRDEKMAELLSKSSYDFQDLCDIVTILRGVGGCPWDIEQDHHSIRKGMIEECYEVVEAIDRDDTALLREELGDVLLQIVFHADIENDAGHFNITDVANDECVKMIHRHPHVFGQVKADTSEQVLANWEVIKTEEKQRVSLSDQLQAIPPILPALMRAQKVGKKMNADADLSDAALIEKLNEDMKQLSDYTDPDKQKQVMGEVLFRMTTLCRRLGLEAEEALTVATE
jgi:tetrapyrrole methylase family protein/MazG family protein